MALEAYRISIADFPVAVIEQAVRNFITGKVEGHNKAFAPSVAELSRECDRIRAKAMHEEYMRTKAREPKQIEYSEEHRRMMLGRLQALASSIKTVD